MENTQRSTGRNPLDIQPRRTARTPWHRTHTMSYLLIPKKTVAFRKTAKTATKMRVKSVGRNASNLDGQRSGVRLSGGGVRVSGSGVRVSGGGVRVSTSALIFIILGKYSLFRLSIFVSMINPIEKTSVVKRNILCLYYKSM